MKRSVNKSARSRSYHRFADLRCFVGTPVCWVIRDAFTSGEKKILDLVAALCEGGEKETWANNEKGGFTDAGPLIGDCCQPSVAVSLVTFCHCFIIWFAENGHLAVMMACADNLFSLLIIIRLITPKNAGRKKYARDTGRNSQHDMSGIRQSAKAWL